jgi:peptidoglycan/xylan/chitin deacetylase (PgdA/CDA1 family)
MSHLLSTISYGSFRRLGVTAVSRRLRPAAPVLCYHNVALPDECRHGEPGLHMPRERFERQVRWLAAHYDVVPLGDYIRRLTTRSARPAAAITFDDAYQGIFDNAVPILRGLGIPATVFVVAEAPGRWPGFWWDQPGVVDAANPDLRRRRLTDLRGDRHAILAEIDASCGAARQRRVGGSESLPASHRPAEWSTIRAHLGSGIAIGAHSATHRSLPTLTDVELTHELEQSGAALHRATGAWPEFFAYPYGSCDARVCAAARRAGYRAAFGLDPSRNADKDRWRLGRINVPSHISDAAFEAWTAGLQLRRAE